MATASIFHLLADPPQIQGPSAVQYISATTPQAGVLTTRILDPAAPPAGAAGADNTFSYTVPTASTHSYVLGRWATKPLPAQTIGAMNWTLVGALYRVWTIATTANTAFGACLAQWRDGTGVVARFFDTPTAGSTLGTQNGSDVISTVFAGGALTLVANDSLVLEVWATSNYGGVSTPNETWHFLYGGTAQQVPGVVSGGVGYTFDATLKFDATLTAATAITFS